MRKRAPYIVTLLIAATLVTWVGIVLFLRSQQSNEAQRLSLYEKSRAQPARDTREISRRSMWGEILTVSPGGLIELRPIINPEIATSSPINAVVTSQTTIYQKWGATGRTDSVKPVGLDQLQAGDLVEIVWSRERVDSKTGSHVLELDIVIRGQASAEKNTQPRR